MAAIGIDFGTTNSSIARATPSGHVEMAVFRYSSGGTDAYRSLLYLEQVLAENNRTKLLRTWTGPVGIEHYLAAETKGRLVQSLKSFLTSRTLQSTEVFGRRIRIEELIAKLLRDLRTQAEAQFGVPIRSAVAGRPVWFVGAEKEEDNTFAEGRVRQALQLAGFEDVVFEMEPVAAAHYYESTLDHDELILIGDFGGGTSDFSLVRVGPTIRRRGRQPSDLLGTEGVGLAGDAFDAKIVRNLVSPALGLGSQIQSLGKLLPVPSWVYAKLERWHHLSLLKNRETLQMLQSVKVQAVEQEKIEDLIHLVTEDLGYHLHQAVQKAKIQLSLDETAEFRFSDGHLQLRKAVDRSSFEAWIGEELNQIAGCVDRLMQKCGVDAADVDMVFLTGGTSFVPAVRRLFESRFGALRIKTGNEFTSVARGLALRALASDRT
jgi:hypothetical chaperone protein